MAYQTLTVVPDDGEPIEIQIEPRDALLWERTGKGNPSILDYLSRPSMIEAYRLAHIAMKRQQQYAGTLKEFEEQYDVRVGYGVGDVEPDPDPTQTEA